MEMAPDALQFKAIKEMHAVAAADQAIKPLGMQSSQAEIEPNMV
jgi:hypothetical protein